MTPAVDVYALGAILYELLVGRAPFLADNPLDILRLVVEAEPVPPRQIQPTVPRDLETVCLACLQKDPKRRYATAEALADDLRRVRNHEPVAARRVGGRAGVEGRPASPGTGRGRRGGGGRGGGAGRRRVGVLRAVEGRATSPSRCSSSACPGS
ncbi:MAG TPA: hypothetical protein VMZ71_12005 [Gemmataceae bacterium]|nr:hypothetical protein [Gemmataceae bacterium]